MMSGGLVLAQDSNQDQALAMLMTRWSDGPLSHF